MILFITIDTADGIEFTHQLLLSLPKHDLRRSISTTRWAEPLIRRAHAVLLKLDIVRGDDVCQHSLQLVDGKESLEVMVKISKSS